MHIRFLFDLLPNYLLLKCKNISTEKPRVQKGSVRYTSHLIVQFFIRAVSRKLAGSRGRDSAGSEAGAVRSHSKESSSVFDTLISSAVGIASKPRIPGR